METGPTGPTGATGPIGEDECFALLAFNWQNTTIIAAKKLSTPVVVDVGIRDFSFDAPLDDPDLAVITVSAVPIVADGQIDPPIQLFGVITGGGAIAGNAVDPTSDVERIYVRVDRVAPSP